jgi:hypothetical protein
MGERKRHDPLLQVRTDLVRHPRPPALAHIERLEPPAVDAALEPVVGRAVHPHRPAGGRDVAELLGQREQAQPKSDQHVMLSHRALLRGSVVVVTPSLSERADAPAAAGASHFNALSSALRVSQELGVSPA